MLKTVLLLAVAGAALGAGAVYAGTGARDVYTDGAKMMGPRDPYTDGGKAGKFDVYTDGASTSRPNDCYSNCGAERQVGGAEAT